MPSWFAFVAAFVVCVALGAVDRQWKAAPHPGYCPEDATWVVQARDFPLFWDALKRLDVARTVGERLPREVHAVELAVRQAAGVRPTPARWRVWFGARFLCAGKRGQWGFCVRPGLLARAADYANRIAGASHPEGDVRRYGRFHYAWREGYLIVSPSRDYVFGALAAPVSSGGGAVSSDSLRVQWRAPCAGEILVHASEGLPVSGRLSVAVSGSGEDLLSARIWPDRPMLVVAGRAWEDWVKLLSGVAPVFAETQGFRALRHFGTPLWQAWRLPPPQTGGDADVREFSLALAGVDVSETLPIPEFALALRAEGPISALESHPLYPLAEAAEPLPYAWREQPGVIAPLLGEKLSLCLAADGAYWLATTQEPLMQKIVGRLEEGPGTRADLVLHVDWEKTAEAGAALLRRAAQLELFPRMDARKAEQKLIPFTQALASMGTLDLQGRGHGDHLRFSGFLARAGEDE